MLASSQPAVSAWQCLSDIVDPYIGCSGSPDDSTLPLQMAHLGLDTDNVDIIPTGSTFEALNYGSPAIGSGHRLEQGLPQTVMENKDLDYMLCLKYCKVLETTAASPDPERDQDVYHLQGTEDPVYYELKSSLEGETLSPVEFVDQCMERYIRKDVCHFVLDHRRSGPAITVKVLGGRNYVHAIDLVWSLKLDCWPSVATEWKTRKRFANWPSGEVIQNIATSGFHVVPVGQSRQLSNPLWRLSFSLAEKMLSKSFGTCHLRSYSLLRRIVNYFVKPTSALPNFYLKTTLYHCCESVPSDIWERSSALGMAVLLIDRLIQYLAAGHMPHFFITSSNLLSGVPKDLLKTTLGRLVGFREDVLGSLCESSLEHQFGLSLPVPIETMASLLSRGDKEWLPRNRLNRATAAFIHVCGGHCDLAESFMAWSSWRAKDGILVLLQNISTCLLEMGLPLGKGNSERLLKILFSTCGLFSRKTTVFAEACFSVLPSIIDTLGLDMPLVRSEFLAILFPLVQVEEQESACALFELFIGHVERKESPTAAAMYVNTIVQLANSQSDPYNRACRFHLALLIALRFTNEKLAVEELIRGQWGCFAELWRRGEVTKAIGSLSGLLDAAMEAYEKEFLTDMTCVTGISLDVACTAYVALKEGGLMKQLYQAADNQLQEFIIRCFEMSIHCSPENVAGLAEYLGFLGNENKLDKALETMEELMEEVLQRADRTSSNFFGPLELGVVDSNIRAYVQTHGSMTAGSALLCHYHKACIFMKQNRLKDAIGAIHKLLPEINGACNEGPQICKIQATEEIQHFRSIFKREADEIEGVCARDPESDDQERARYSAAAELLYIKDKQPRDLEPQVLPPVKTPEAIVLESELSPNVVIETKRHDRLSGIDTQERVPEANYPAICSSCTRAESDVLSEIQTRVTSSASERQSRSPPPSVVCGDASNVSLCETCQASLYLAHCLIRDIVKLQDDMTVH